MCKLIEKEANETANWIHEIAVAYYYYFFAHYYFHCFLLTIIKKKLGKIIGNWWPVFQCSVPQLCDKELRVLSEEMMKLPSGGLLCDKECYQRKSVIRKNVIRVSVIRRDDEVSIWRIGGAIIGELGGSS